MSISDDAKQILEQLCKDLDLSTEQCQLLEEHIPGICKMAPEGEEGSKTKRKRSRWQECIATRRKGKGFDPQAIKQLATEYKAGKCP